MSRRTRSAIARKLLVSDQAGKSNVLAELERIGIKVDKDDPRIARLLEEVKEREAPAMPTKSPTRRSSLLARRVLGNVPDYFDVDAVRRQCRAAHTTPSASASP